MCHNIFDQLLTPNPDLEEDPETRIRARRTEKAAVADNRVTLQGEVLL